MVSVRTTIEMGLVQWAAAVFVTLTLVVTPCLAAFKVVINEVHYHPADDGRDGEFIEVCNFDTVPVNLAGWSLRGGVSFDFPPGTLIQPGQHLVVANDALTLFSRYALDPQLIVGEYTGKLANGGELLELVTDRGLLISFVDYQDDGAWPGEPDGLGPSLERVSPGREENDPWAWRTSLVVGGTPGEQNSVHVPDPDLSRVLEVVAAGAEWRYFRGLTEPSATWNTLGFNDTGWELGDAGFGFGDDDDNTILDDMANNGYFTVYIRHEFSIVSADEFANVHLTIDFDDGFVAYINGEEIARMNVEATGHDAPATGSREAGSSIVFSVPVASGMLNEGQNVLAVVGHNRVNSSDFSLSPALSVVSELEIASPPSQSVRAPVINELTAGAVGTGWVELFNPTDDAVDVSGWRLGLYPSSSGEYQFADDASVGAGAYVVVNEVELGFELDDIAALVLATASGEFIDGLNPRAITVTQSTGRFPDGDDNRFVFTAPSSGGANAAVLEDRVVVTELMINPAPGNTGGEFIELENRSGESVSLLDWAFTQGVTFTFGNVVMASGERLVIAKDPAAAEVYYGITGVLGPYLGVLKNDAETLVLRDDLRNVADRVDFADEGSWPEEADALGPSVELIHVGLDNRHGDAWRVSIGEGTPGVANSQVTVDPEPIVVDVQHHPVVPTSADSVQVLATLSDDSMITGATLFYEIDGEAGPPTPVALLDDGASDDGVSGNGVYGAMIPPQADLSVIAFWIEAQAGAQTVTSPAGAPTSAFLYEVEDSRPADVRPLYRIVMRAADRDELFTRNVRSDVLLDITFIAAGKAYYNRGIRFRGRSARRCSPVSFRIQFDHDRSFHGIKRLNLNGCEAQRQWIGLDFLRHVGMFTPHSWFRRVSINGERQATMHLRVEAIDDEFLERVEPNDNDGNLYRGESRANLDYRGVNFAPYRAHYLKRTNEGEDDFSDVVDLCFRFSETTAEQFPVAVEERVDVAQWAEYFAAYAILGSTENAIVLNNGDDYYLYHGFLFDRWKLFAWDFDSVFDDPEQILFRPTVPAIVRYLKHPRYAPDYWCSVEDMFNRAFDPALVSDRIDHLDALFPPMLTDPLRDYVPLRRAFIEAQIERDLEVTLATGGTVCDGTLVPDQASVTLDGKAPGCGTTEVRLNGELATYDPVTTSWSHSLNVGGLTTIDIVSLYRDGSTTATLTLAVDAQCPEFTESFLRCDSNSDGENDISDPIFVLRFLFASAGVEASCMAALDCNSDQSLNLADALFDLNHLFGSGVQPPSPYPGCESAPQTECAEGGCGVN